MQTKNIYLLVGESGNGKTAVAEELEKRYGLTSIRSYTTRPKRSPDEAGHVFVSNEEFDKLDDLVAYTEFDKFRYGTTADQIEQNSLYIIDPAGVTYFKEHYLGNKHPYVIYLDTPMKERILRMHSRGDTDTQIVQRVINDIDAFDNVLEFSDASIQNLDFEDCVTNCFRYILLREVGNAETSCSV